MKILISFIVACAINLIGSFLGFLQANQFLLFTVQISKIIYILEIIAQIVSYCSIIWLFEKYKELSKIKIITYLFVIVKTINLIFVFFELNLYYNAIFGFATIILIIFFTFYAFKVTNSSIKNEIRIFSLSLLFAMLFLTTAPLLLGLFTFDFKFFTFIRIVHLLPILALIYLLGNQIKYFRLNNH